MGQSTWGVNNWFLNSRPTVDSIKNIFLEYIHRKLTIIIMKVAICFTCVFAMAYAESRMAAPYTLIVKRAAQPEPQNTRFNFGSRPSSSSSANNANTRFFTGNGALDAGLAGAAAGFAGQYVANQVFNPCTRGGTRKQNTNNRIFGEILETFFLELSQDLQGHQLQTLLLEVHVGDKISY